jgi:xanthine dehydrogenase accessory factor
MTSSVQPTVYDAMRRAAEERIPAATVTVVKGSPLGKKLTVIGGETTGTLGDPELDAIAVAGVAELLAAEKSETRPITHKGEEVELFFDVYPPSPTLLIFGAVHVAQALTRFAKALGFRVVVSDARTKLATRERFPEADEIIQAWPDEALLQVSIEPNTYVAILTHDPKFDEPALIGTLETKAAYIGAVGSRKTNRDRKVRLREAGVPEAQIEKIRGPVGLDIGANTPEEMAISILAEIIAVRHGRKGGPLTEATGAIRADS